MKSDVIIAGAGIAGQAAESRLQKAGLSVQVLEARPRLGGRIHTIRDSELPLPIELGAELSRRSLARPRRNWHGALETGLWAAERVPRAF